MIISLQLFLIPPLYYSYYSFWIHVLENGQSGGLNSVALNPYIYSKTHFLAETFLKICEGCSYCPCHFRRRLLQLFIQSFVVNPPSSISYHLSHQQSACRTMSPAWITSSLHCFILTLQLLRFCFLSPVFDDKFGHHRSEVILFMTLYVSNRLPLELSVTELF